VFRFAAWNGGGTPADWLLPAAGLFEETTDIPTAPGSAIETYAIAEKLVAPPCEVHSAAELLMAVDSKMPTVEEAIKTRAGELRTGEIRTGPPPRAGGIECRLKEWPPISEQLTAQDWTAGWVAPVLPPLATKLYRDSGLRPAPNGRLI
jgi:hypothetical protein